MPRPVPHHDHDAGGPAEVLAAKAELRQQVWAEMRAARVARFPGAAGRIPNVRRDMSLEAARQVEQALSGQRPDHAVNDPH